MSSADSILGYLDIVARERTARAASAGLAARVQTLKHFQQRRFSHTYADLLASPRHGPAARFFLDELYGPSDFSQRDAQFARVVPALVRLFPRDVVDTVQALAQLHALSEQLDTEMARRLEGEAVDAPAYIAAWQATGRAADREAQVSITVSVGRSLDELTRKPLLRQSLRMMRGPAWAAGLSSLQKFLEKGFDTFVAMKGAQEFLAMVSQRERALAAALFDAGALTEAAARARALGQLP